MNEDLTMTAMDYFDLADLLGELAGVRRVIDPDLLYGGSKLDLLVRKCRAAARDAGEQELDGIDE